MTSEKIYKAVLDKLRADQRGNLFNPDEYNRLSDIINRQLLSHYAKDFEKDAESTSNLGFLKKIGQTLALTSGVASFPSDYYRIIGEPYYTDGDSIRRNVDIVTSQEHSAREKNYLTQSTVNYPVCVIGGQSNDAYKYLQVRVYPTTITSIIIDYLRIPTTPFLDYYIDNTTLNYTFLTVGQSYTVTSSQTYRDGTTGAKTSATVNWEWDEDQLPLIIAFFCKELGFTIPDEVLIQKGVMDINNEISE